MAGTRVVAPPPLSESTAPPIYRPPRRGARRLLIGLNIFVALCLVAVAVAYGYVSYRNGQIRREKIAGVQGGSAGQPETILLVGSDTRAGLVTAQDKKTFGVTQDAGGQRSDTIMLLHLDPATKSATLMSLPRDLWVPIPGTTHSDRINSTFDKGPALLVQAIHDDLGITVNHYVEVDFVSFRGVVNSVGAVHVYFPTPARDTYSGLNITTPGCYGLDGNMALQYVRARHYQYYLNGRWHTEGLSDLARIKRQQDFIRKIATKAISTGLTSPVKLNGVISSLVSNLTVDSGFHLSDMVALARKWRTFNPNALQTATLPNTPTVVGGQDVLLVKQPDAQQVINQFLGVQPAPTPATSVPIVNPADVSVRVDNGTGRPGQAASVASSLRQRGFVVTGTGSAASFGYASTTLRYAPGQQAKAQYLQHLIVGGADLVADASLTGSDILLITGSSYGGLTSSGTSTPTTAPAPAAGATPSTAPPTTASPIPGMPANPPPCPA